MPRSKSTTSARTSSSGSCSSAAANGARMKRARMGSSSASAAKRSCAAGSRSIAMSSPSGPRRSATSRAWPPPPNVQSTATSPGRGASAATSSPASTGTWAVCMSTSMADGGGDLGELVGERAVVLAPGGAVPDLEAIARAGHHDLLAQRGVLDQEAGHHHAPRGVELRVERVGAEEARELAGLIREGMHALKRRTRVVLEAARGPQLHAALDALGEEH